MKKNLLLTAAVFMFLMFSCFQYSDIVFGEENNTGWAAALDNAQDNLIGSTFKTFAKTFILVVDMDKVKNGNIAKIKKMDDGKFNKRYAKIYAVIKDLPEDLKVKYGVVEGMTKEQVIEDIELIDKNKLYAEIDSVPNSFIAGQFKKYLAEKGKELKKINFGEEINKFWNKTIKKAY